MAMKNIRLGEVLIEAGTITEAQLAEALELIVEPNEKVRLIFDYDPNFPRALFQCVRWPADEKQITESEYTSTPEG